MAFSRNNPTTVNRTPPYAAYRLADWLLSPAGQAAIGAYKVDGEQLFHPSTER